MIMPDGSTISTSPLVKEVTEEYLRLLERGSQRLNNEPLNPREKGAFVRFITTLCASLVSREGQTVIAQFACPVYSGVPLGALPRTWYVCAKNRQHRRGGRHSGSDIEYCLCLDGTTTLYSSREGVVASRNIPVMTADLPILVKGILELPEGSTRLRPLFDKLEKAAGK